MSFSFVFLVGRIIFSIMLIGSGIDHITRPDGAAGYAESRGVKNARTLTQIAGVVWLVAAATIILGLLGDLGALLAAGQLLVIMFMVHTFWKETDPMNKQNEMTQFMKNLSMVGGALVIFAVFGALGEGLDLVITDPVIELDLP